MPIAEKIAYSLSREAIELATEGDETIITKEKIEIILSNERLVCKSKFNDNQSKENQFLHKNKLNLLSSE